MPVPALAVAGLGMLGSGLSTYFNSRTAKRNTDATNQSNRELAEYAYSKDLEMWQKNNAYNTPASQMERLKNAGLNPNLIYGNGTVTGNTSASTPKYNAPRQEYNYQPEIDPMAMLSSYQNMAQQSQDIQYQKQKTETEFMNTWLTQTKQSNLMTDGQIRSVEYDYLMNTLNARTQQQNAKLIYDNASSIIRTKQSEWAKNGMNPSDATWLRMTFEFLQTLNISDELIQKMKNQFPSTIQPKKQGR